MSTEENKTESNEQVNPANKQHKPIDHGDEEQNLAKKMDVDIKDMQERFDAANEKANEAVSWAVLAEEVEKTMSKREITYLFINYYHTAKMENNPMAQLARMFGE